MWRFKTSKYKNAAPKIPKKEEWLNDIHVGNLLQSCGNHIKASAQYVAFNIDSSGGSSLGALPLTAKGRQEPGKLPTIHAHSDFVTDFDFSPCDDCLLATGSQDCTVNIWRLPEGGLTENLTSAELSLTREERKIESVSWHPLVASVLALTSANILKVFDVTAQQEQTVFTGHKDQVQSLSWHGDGSLVVTSCKDKQLRILDPRSNSVVQEASGPQNLKDSRALWLGNKDLILTTGFDTMRQREVVLRDVRKFTEKLKTITMETSTGILMPFFDADTSMLFLAGKGDTSIRYLELSETEPYLTENATDTVDQIKGVAMVPKRALDVMNCEVDRLLLLSQHAVVPITYHVPRKSYTEFHEDLFPDTFSGEATMTADEWFSGENKPMRVVSLDPAKRGRPSVAEAIDKARHQGAQHAHTAATHDHTPEKPAATPEHTPEKPAATREHIPEKASIPNKPVESTPAVVWAAGDAPVSQHTVVAPLQAEPHVPSQDVLQEKHKQFTGVRSSKFRHLKGTSVHKSLNIENIRNLSKTTPGESNGFHGNKKFCAVPLGGSAGLVAVIQTDAPGRLPDMGVPAIQNGSILMDFVWDPFDDHRLVTVCDDAQVRVWRIPEGGLTDNLEQPEMALHGHQEKIYFARYNPLAKDVLATASYDMTLRIWDLAVGECVIQLEGHTDAVFCLAWSPDGKYCATVCKDGRVRIYNPRSSTQPIQEGTGPAGTRGARVAWICGGSHLLVSGFNRTSTRILLVYDVSDLSSPLSQTDLDTSPAILVPHYDADSCTVFLTGRGDSTVFAFEASEEHPHLFDLANYTAEGLHQALSFLPKNLCDVRRVEFARALRLTTHNIQPISFTVPRVKTEYFQDDLFPDTKVTWEPVLTSSEWFSGVNRLPKTQSMRPTDMTPLSEAPVEAPKAKKYESFYEYQETHKTEQEKSDELINAMMGKLDITNDPLPQDLTEGVDEDEWSD